jgi:hypothetical protein
MSNANSSRNSSVTVDVYTQKEPYSGRGQNMPSDAFGPEDVVILHALVTKGNTTVSNTLVGFEVELPNATHFSISAPTDVSGTATINFTITTPPINVSESDIFGIWAVRASVLSEGQVYEDMLHFKVDWIVKLLSVRTIDENLTDRNHFGTGGEVGFEITLRSIAMTLRNATIEILVKDELGVPVNFSQIRDFAVQPNEKVIFLYYKIAIPKFAYLGSAKVFVSAFNTEINQTGVPYCPTISTPFTLTTETPLKINYHDVAVVTVIPSAAVIEIGQGLTLETLVRNEGTVFESFTVGTYFDKKPLGSSQVTSLLPYATTSFKFTVETSLLTLGNHTIGAYIAPVPLEVDLTDNNFTDIIEVRSKLPEVIHDIAVTDITLSNSSAFVGAVLEIDVTVLNKGTETKSFDLSVYSNSSLIENRRVNDLIPQSQVLLTFSWNTSTLNEGFYRIMASAPLLNDINPTDNTLIDGLVQLESPEKPLHDVAVLNVVPSTRIISVGEIVDIRVTIKNKGKETESFNVTLYYGNSTIGMILVEDLAPSIVKSIFSKWNTSNIPLGSYVISAMADVVKGETNINDNTFVDGIVTVVQHDAMTPLLGSFILFTFLVAIIAACAIFVLVIAFFRRRRRRRLGSSYTIIVHPHI